MSRWDEIGRALHDRPSDRTLGRHLSVVTRGLLRGHHASICLVERNQYVVFDSTDTVARRLDEYQVTVGQGPIFSVMETGTPTIVDDSTDRLTYVRWPIFGSFLGEAGIGSLLCFPLVSGGARIGAITSYRDTPWAPDPDTYTDGLILAELTVDIVLHALAGAGDIGFARELAPSLADRAVIQQAAGATAEQLGITIGDAMIRLRAHAFSTGEHLASLARRVMSGETAIEP